MAATASTGRQCSAGSIRWRWAERCCWRPTRRNSFSGQHRNSGRLLYWTVRTAAGCTAGFQATAQQGTGAVTLQPIIQGTPAGTTFAVNPANQYTLRVRGYIARRCNRALAIYRSLVTAAPLLQAASGICVRARFRWRYRSLSNGVGAMPVTLYDGAHRQPTRIVHGGGSQQHQPDWNHARVEPDESWLRLGGEYAAERRPLHAARWHAERSRRVPSGAHRQARVLYRLCAGGRGADRGKLSHRGQSRGARGEHCQPAGSLRRQACPRGCMDRLGDRVRPRAAPRIAAMRHWRWSRQRPA